MITDASKKLAMTIIPDAKELILALHGCLR